MSKILTAAKKNAMMNKNKMLRNPILANRMDSPTAKTSTYDWIKHLPTALLHQDQIPLLGTPPQFPWESFSSKLGEFFSLPDLIITPKSTPEWRKPEEFYQGLGLDPVPLYVTLTPSMPPVCWVLAVADIQLLMSMLLTGEMRASEGLDSTFRTDFYHYLAMETLQTVLSLDFDKTLSPQLLEAGSLPSEIALCLDISITVNQRTIIGRLILSPEFHHAWKERYTPRTLDISRQLMQQVNVTLQIEGGKTKLKTSEWANVHPGDFIVLDFCSLKPDGEGRVMLTIDDTPLFRGKIKDGNIKILEHPLYYEGDNVMSADKLSGEDPSVEGQEQEFFDEDLNDAESNEEGSEELGEFEFDENAEGTEDEDEHLDASVSEEHHEEEAEEPSSGHEEHAPVSTISEPKKGFSLEDIPLNIVVEVGRLQMSLQKLMELQPGNVLDLSVRPESGVDLVVNGKRIAKGELLLIGEALGVRILDIG